METLRTYLDMGGHGGFIWASYAMVLIVLFGLWLSSWRFVRRSAANLDHLNAARPPHRQGDSNEA